MDESTEQKVDELRGRVAGLDEAAELCGGTARPAPKPTFWRTWKGAKLYG